MELTVEWSADNGKTWREIEVKPTTPIAVYLKGHHGLFADGVGNVYRYPERKP